MEIERKQCEMHPDLGMNEGILRNEVDSGQNGERLIESEESLKERGGLKILSNIFRNKFLFALAMAGIALSPGKLSAFGERNQDLDKDGTMDYIEFQTNFPEGRNYSCIDYKHDFSSQPVFSSGPFAGCNKQQLVFMLENRYLNELKFKNDFNLTADSIPGMVEEYWRIVSEVTVDTVVIDSPEMPVAVSPDEENQVYLSFVANFSPILKRTYHASVLGREADVDVKAIFASLGFGPGLKFNLKDDEMKLRLFLRYMVEYQALQSSLPVEKLYDLTQINHLLQFGASLDVLRWGKEGDMNARKYGVGIGGFVEQDLNNTGHRNIGGFLQFSRWDVYLQLAVVKTMLGIDLSPEEQLVLGRNKLEDPTYVRFVMGMDFGGW